MVVASWYKREATIMAMKEIVLPRRSMWWSMMAHYYLICAGSSTVRYISTTQALAGLTTLKLVSGPLKKHLRLYYFNFARERPFFGLRVVYEILGNPLPTVEGDISKSPHIPHEYLTFTSLKIITIKPRIHSIFMKPS